MSVISIMPPATLNRVGDFLTLLFLSVYQVSGHYPASQVFHVPQSEKQAHHPSIVCPNGGKASKQACSDLRGHRRGEGSHHGLQIKAFSTPLALLLRPAVFPCSFSTRSGLSGSCRSDATLWLTGLCPRAGLREMWWPCTWKASLLWWRYGWVWLWSAWRPRSSTTIFESSRWCTASACQVLRPWCLGLRWKKVGSRVKDLTLFSKIRSD